MRTEGMVEHQEAHLPLPRFAWAVSASVALAFAGFLAAGSPASAADTRSAHDVTLTAGIPAKRIELGDALDDADRDFFNDDDCGSGSGSGSGNHGGAGSNAANITGNDTGDTGGTGDTGTGTGDTGTGDTGSPSGTGVSGRTGVSGTGDATGDDTGDVAAGVVGGAQGVVIVPAAPPSSIVVTPQGSTMLPQSGGMATGLGEQGIASAAQSSQFAPAGVVPVPASTGHGGLDEQAPRTLAVVLGAAALSALALAGRRVMRRG